MSIHDIITYVENHTGITAEEIKGTSRKKERVAARQCAQWLCRNLFKKKHTFSSIGDYFGNRNHSTIMHACVVVENMIWQKDPLYDWVEHAAKEIRNNYRGFTKEESEKKAIQQFYVILQEIELAQTKGRIALYIAKLLNDQERTLMNGEQFDWLYTDILLKRARAYAESEQGLIAIKADQMLHEQTNQLHDAILNKNFKPIKTTV